MGLWDSENEQLVLASQTFACRDRLKRQPYSDEHLTGQGTNAALELIAL